MSTTARTEQLSPLQRLREVANLVNLSTPAGLGLSVLGRATRRHGPNGLVVADRVRLPISAGAMTIGNVVLVPGSIEALRQRFPRLLDHEGVHATQWALLGPLFPPLYALACGWSLLRTGNRASGNIFERWAGLADGGYEYAAGPVGDRRVAGQSA